jgi:hypothetical protein
MNTSINKCTKTAALAGTAMLMATMLSPQQAKADATLAAALGGTALLGLILHANQPTAFKTAAPTQHYYTQHTPVYYPQRYVASPVHTYYAPAAYFPARQVVYAPSPTYYVAW